jgi:hypothetical protein
MDTSAQLYELSNPSGRHIMIRRRLTTTLGIAGYDLLRDEALPPADRAKAPQLTMRMRLRLDPDFGVESAEVAQRNEPRFVPGLERAPLDLMYAYIEGRRFLRGALGFRLGRQYQMDALGFWSFDGAQLQLSAPKYVSFEAYGGLEVRGGFPLSSPRFERDGVWRGTRDGLSAGSWVGFIDRSVAPAMGASVESQGFDWGSARVSYRKVWNTGEVSGNPLSSTALSSRVPSNAPFDLGSRVSQERVAATLNLGKGPFGAKLGWVYDLYTQQTQNAYVSLDAYLGKAASLHLDYDYLVPLFDGDSIWNFFGTEASHMAAARADLDLSDRISVGGGSSVRAVASRIANPLGGALGVTAAASTETRLTGGGNLYAKAVTPLGKLGLRGDVSTGYVGHRSGAELTVDKTIERRYLLSGRASFWSFADTTRPDRSATSFGYVAGVGYLVGERSKVLGEFEHNVNRLVGHRYRIMLLFQTAVSR